MAREPDVRLDSLCRKPLIGCVWIFREKRIITSIIRIGQTKNHVILFGVSFKGNAYEQASHLRGAAFGARPSLPGSRGREQATGSVLLVDLGERGSGP